MTKSSSIWYEKYRPQKIDQFIFPNERIQTSVEHWIEQNKLPGHLLFSGIQGTGKSTLARVLKNTFIEDPDFLELNASLSGNIETIRERLIPFCQMSPLGEKKMVLFEEADRLSNEFQKSLRQIMEDYNQTTIFVFTCNYPNKIIPAIHSRFSEEFEFNELNEEKIFDYLIDILGQENIELDDEESINKTAENLQTHINLFKPDIRKIINSIQSSFDSYLGFLNEPKNLTQGTDSLDEWKNIWKNGATLEQCIELAKQIDHDNVDDFYRIMYDNVRNLPNNIDQERTIVLIGLHLFRAKNGVADQEINLMSCLYRIFLNIEE